MSDVYTQAAGLLGRLTNKQTTLKAYLFPPTKGPAPSTPHAPNRAVYALVCECLKYKPVLQEVVGSTGVARLKVSQTNPNLVLAMVHDMVLGKGVRGGGRVRKELAGHEHDLRAALVRLKARAGVREASELLPKYLRFCGTLPRYVRVNTLKASVEDVRTQLAATGLSAQVDGDIPEVLSLPPDAKLHHNTLLREGLLIGQDKASCVPAHVLRPEADWDVIDACAAPGNKTSHLSAVMGREATGRVFAFDIDEKRLASLVRLTSRAGASNVVARHKSFLEVDPNDSDFAGVRGILLDPSCSGSGMVNQLDHLSDHDATWRLPSAASAAPQPVGSGVSQAAHQLKQQLLGLYATAHQCKGEGGLQQQQPLPDPKEEGVDEWGRSYNHDNVTALAAFQLKALLHAFKFPNVQRVSYSTCSIHDAENEGVVKQALASQSRFRLVPAMPDCPHRGRTNLLSEGGKCVRLSPERGSTIGFFVALFERVAEGPSTTPQPAAGHGKRSKKAKAKAKRRALAREAQ